MTLEIHFDQLQNAADTFNTGNTAFITASALVCTQVSHQQDALAQAHQSALSVVGGLLAAGNSNFSQVSMATQSVIDGFKAADQAGGLH